MDIHAILPPKGRDLRLDLFRGIANWAIYLDHIPDNVVNWVTTRNYGFSDAADLFDDMQERCWNDFRLLESPDVAQHRHGVGQRTYVWEVARGPLDFQRGVRVRASPSRNSRREFQLPNGQVVSNTCSSGCEFAGVVGCLTEA